MPTGDRTLRGYGALSIEQQAQVIQMLNWGARQKDVGKALGVSKNVVAGIWSRFGQPVTKREPTTLHSRLDALHAKLDRVLAENLGRGKIAEPEREPRR